MGIEMAVKAEKSAAGSAAPSANVAPDAGAPGVTPKRRGRAKGAPIGPRLLWGGDRDLALASVLKQGWTKSDDGSTWVRDASYSGIHTAASVATALAQHPAFANPEAPVTPARVKAYIESTVKIREKKGLPVHPWLALSRGARSRDTSAFD